MQASNKIMEQAKVANQREDKKLSRELTEIKQIEKARRYEIRGEQLSLHREITINKLSNMKKALRNSVSEVGQDKNEGNDAQKSPGIDAAAPQYGISLSGAIMKRDTNKAKIRKPLPSLSSSMSESSKYLTATIAAVAADEQLDDSAKEIFIYYPINLSRSKTDVESTVKRLLPSGVLKLPDLMPSLETITEYVANKQKHIKRWGYQSREDRLLKWQSYCLACNSNGNSRQDEHYKPTYTKPNAVLPPIVGLTKSSPVEVVRVDCLHSEEKQHEIDRAETAPQEQILTLATGDETEVTHHGTSEDDDRPNDDYVDEVISRDETKSKEDEKQQQPTTTQKGPAGQIPAYVQLLGRLKSNAIDQYTDGSMHLEVRRQEQIQRERMGVPPGHLPVRRRHTVAVDDGGRPSEGDAVNKPRVSVPPRKKAPVRVYISKEMRSDRKLEESRKQIEHISHVKRAVELDTLRRAIDRTASFLGRQPLSVRLMPQQALSAEEMQMLGRLQQQKLAAASLPGVKKNRRRQGLAVRFRHSVPGDLNKLEEYYDDIAENATDEVADDNVFLS